MFNSVGDKNQSPPNLDQLTTKTKEVGVELAKVRGKQSEFDVRLFKLQNSIREAGKDAKNAKEGIYTPAQKEVYQAFAAKQRELLHTTKKKVEEPLTLRGHKIAKAEAAYDSAGAKIQPQKKILGLLWNKSLKARIAESTARLEIAKKINLELKEEDKKIDQNIKKIQVRTKRLAELSKETITALDGISKQKHQIDQQLRSWSNSLPQMDPRLRGQMHLEIARLRGCKKDLIELEKTIKSIGFSTVNAEDTKVERGEEKGTLNAYDRQMKSLKEELVGSKEFPNGELFAIGNRINESINVGKSCEAEQERQDEIRKQNKMPLRERLYTRIFGYTSTPVPEPSLKNVSIQALRQLIEFQKPLDKIDAEGTLKGELARVDEKIQKAEHGSTEALDDLYDLFVVTLNASVLIKESGLSEEVKEFQGKMTKSFPQITKREAFDHVIAYWKKQASHFSLKKTLKDPRKIKDVNDARKALANPKTEEDRKRAEATIRGFDEMQKELLATENELRALEEKHPTIEANYRTELEKLPEGKLKNRLAEALKVIEELPHSAKGEFAILPEKEIRDLERWKMKYEGFSQILALVNTALDKIFSKDLLKHGCDVTRLKELIETIAKFDKDNTDGYNNLITYLTEFESVINDARSIFYTQKPGTQEWVRREDMNADQIMTENTKIQDRLNDLTKKYQYLHLPSASPTSDQYARIVDFLNNKVSDLKKKLPVIESRKFS